MTSTDPMATALRTHLCGALRDVHVGERVRVGGWVHRARNLGGLVFVDLRDRAGLLQVSFAPGAASAEALQVAEQLTPETVVLVEGEVVARPPEGRNPDLETGTIELRAAEARIVGPAVTPAIPVARGKGEKLAAEELRLKHRILDLRRPELQANLIMRHRLLQRARRTMSDLGFLEIETPILTKPTPEGARDFLVPSRMHRGEFFALPQSPQIYKQLLMVAGYDRYFQIARCFRDEDLRADRQLEFTQIDLEASFVSAADVQQVVEDVLVALWQEGGYEIARPFPTLTWREAMERFGVDKPDLRYGVEIEDLSGHVGDDAAPFVRDALGSGGRVRGVRVPAAADASRKEIDGFAAAAKDAGAGGLIWARRTENGWEGQGVKAIGAQALDALGGTPGELLLAVSGPDDVTSPALHAVRTMALKRPGIPQLQAHAFCWVVDFPLFEKDPESGQHVPAHHPFTSPHADDFALPRVRSRALSRAALRRRLQRQRAGERFDPYHRPGDPGAHLPPVGDRCRGAAAALRLPPGRPRRRRAAARRLRPRLRPDRDAAGRRPVAARRDRLPQDDRRARTVRRSADDGQGRGPAGAPSFHHRVNRA